MSARAVRDGRGVVSTSTVESAVRRFIDTSILVAAIDRSDPDRRLVARGTLAAGADAGLVTSTQVLSEFFLAARRLAKPAEEDVALALVREVAAHVEVVAVTADDVVAAIGLATSGMTKDFATGEELGHWDALIVRTAIAARCDVLCTSDLEDGLRFVGLDGSGGPHRPAGTGGLVVEDPFLD